MSEVSFIAARLADAPRVKGLTLLRTGGVSKGTYASLNLAVHAGDDPQAVAINRQRVMAQLDLPSQPIWLDQCHGTRVAVLDEAAPMEPVPATDAAVTRVPGRVLAVLTADCLPVLFCSRAAGVIAIAHAGWRGLAAGILENTLAAMRAAPESVSVWLGPAIGPDAFEVGGEVRAAFIDEDASLADCFAAARDGKWLADLAALARRRLGAAGVTRFEGGTWCTSSDPARFFSYRRDGECGRMASLIWIAPSL